MATVLQQRNAPESFRALDLADAALDRVVMDTPDYVDLYTASASHVATVTAEQLARAAFEDGPAVGRFLAWRAALRLRLEPHPWAPWRGAAASSPDYLAGWKITDRGENWIRIKARSSSLTAFCVFQVDGDQATMATFMRYDRRAGRMVWTPVSFIHRFLALPVLRAGLRRLTRPAAA